MSFVDEAFKELNISSYTYKLSYSARFNGYNANIRKTRTHYDIRLSKIWQSVSEDIQKGCVQSLLLRFHKDQERTQAVLLYNDFLKALTEYAPRKDSDAYLASRFHLLNEEYFSGLMSMPNLEWGSYSLTHLGRYEYSTDTVRISTALREDEQLLDYVLYHELLHKKHKFTASKNSTRHHTKAFREEEALFKIKDVEKRLSRFVQEKRRKKPKKSFLQKLFSR
ncbi:MAG: hypothetical protein ACMXYD_01600 [Candidatus Woesearchaeota archaeon]